MSRYTKAQIAEAKEILSFVINGEASIAKPKSGKEKFAGEAKLVKALKVHYGGNFEDSELAKASYEEFDKANLRSLMLTWGILNKQPSVEAFVGKKKSSVLRNTW